VTPTAAAARRQYREMAARNDNSIRNNGSPWLSVRPQTVQRSTSYNYFTALETASSVIAAGVLGRDPGRLDSPARISTSVLALAGVFWITHPICVLP
jgi:hypothetical protein